MRHLHTFRADALLLPGGVGLAALQGLPATHKLVVIDPNESETHFTSTADAYRFVGRPEWSVNYEPVFREAVIWTDLQETHVSIIVSADEVIYVEKPIWGIDPETSDRDAGLLSFEINTTNQTAQLRHYWMSMKKEQEGEVTTYHEQAKLGVIGTIYPVHKHRLKIHGEFPTGKYHGNYSQLGMRHVEGLIGELNPESIAGHMAEIRSQPDRPLCLTLPVELMKELLGAYEEAYDRLSQFADFIRSLHPALTLLEGTRPLRGSEVKYAIVAH